MFDTVGLAEPEEPADDWDITADWPVSLAEGMGPTGAALNLLAGVDPATLSQASSVAALAQLVAIDAHLQAVRARYTFAIAGPPLDDPREEWAAHEIALAARCSVYAADCQIRLARDLAGRLSATFAALELGRISYPQARALSDGVAQLDDELAQRIEANLLKFAWRQDLTKFKICLRRWIARLDPDFAAKAQEAREDAQVEHTALDDGTGELFIRGPLEKTVLIDTALSAYASATKSALGGTAANRKLAALTRWAEDYLGAPDAPRRHGRPYGVNLLLDAPTLFGVANHPAASPHSTIPAAVADLDHNLPYAEGGPTNSDNVTPQDRRWHRAKTHAGWTYVKNKNGSVTWTSPTGQTHRVDPHDYRLGP